MLMICPGVTLRVAVIRAPFPPRFPPPFAPAATTLIEVTQGGTIHV